MGKTSPRRSGPRGPIEADDHMGDFDLPNVENSGDLSLGKVPRIRMEIVDIQDEQLYKI